MLDRARLLAAFDRLGTVALTQGAKLELAIYGGSALLLASNFRYSTEDVDVADATHDQPRWLRDEVAKLAAENGWAADWLNDAVAVHLSPLASKLADHVEFGSFPRGGGPYGLDVIVPSAHYLLALKLKAMRVLDPVRGKQEASDIAALLQVVGVSSPEEVIAVLGRFFPSSAASPEKQLFLLKRLRSLSETFDAPRYPISSSDTDRLGDRDRDRDR